MRNQSSRRFNLLDAMILIAATAVGIAWSRAKVAGTNLPDGLGFAVLCGSVGFAAAWSLSLIAIRLRPPRPPWHRLACQPGFLACAMVPVVLVMEIVGELETLVYTLARGSGAVFWVEYYLRNIGDGLGWSAEIAVAAAWATIALGGRWRPEKRWDERLCFFLGLYWLALPQIHWAVALIWAPM